MPVMTQSGAPGGAPAGGPGTGGGDLGRLLETLKGRLAAGESGRKIDERVGTLQVRLAETVAEVDAAMRLRHRVFYDEMKARPSAEVAASRRDFDEFDPWCDHLLVLDRAQGDGPESVVGTYRMLRRAGAERVGRFYSASEYDVSAIVAHRGEVLEMGRSCIDAAHRTRAAMQALWRGVTAYVLANKIDILFGCASLHGTDPATMKVPLAYLYHSCLAPPEIRPRALPGRYVDMNVLPAAAINGRQALRLLPPMIKGYLRLGGAVGDGAVIDHEFNTVDVCVVVQMDRVTDKYIRHYTREIGGDGEDGAGP